MAGAVRIAMWCIGQAPQRTRWANLAHKISIGFDARAAKQMKLIANIQKRTIPYDRNRL
jgi:hypothetical protein